VKQNTALLVLNLSYRDVSLMIQNGILKPGDVEVAKQGISRHIPSATNTHPATERRFDAVSYSVRSISNTQYVVKENTRLALPRTYCQVCG
jgi:hypothetical protein